MAKAIDTRRHRAALPVFTPSAVSAESLALRTVGRDVEIERLVRAIRTAATTDNRPHQLIVGPRGSGKSHLLIVALHEAMSDEQIADRVTVAMLPEDAVEIAGYNDLLVSIIDRAPGGDEGFRVAARDLRARRDTAGLERLVLEQVGEHVLILVVENLDRVFRDLGDIGQARLRNLTETSAKVLLLASAPLLSDAMSDHARPWYGSFEVEHLQELDAEQGRDLLQRVAAGSGDEELAASLDSPKGLARVRAVEHLAGGSPRMWTVLAGCITVELLDELVPLVEALFDELAPYYQQRLWELAGVERKLVYELCRGPAATVRELAHATGLSQRAAATSLGRLYESRWVRREKRAGDRRATWYSLREPLLRHHVEYRETRAERLPAIVGFLRIWFEVEELAGHLATVGPASLPETYLLAALMGRERLAWRGAWPMVKSAEELVPMARYWITRQTPSGLASRAAGVIVEAVGVSVLEDLAGGRAVATRRLADGTAPDTELMKVVESALAAVGDAVDDPLDACKRGLFAASEAEALTEERDRIALGLLAGAMDPAELREAWFSDYRAVAARLPAHDDRLRIIFLATKALAELRWDRADALAGVRDVLHTCSERLGDDDLTTLAFAGKVAARAMSAPHSDEHLRTARSVVDVIVRGGMPDELTRLLIAAYLTRRSLSSLTNEEPNLGWNAVWAEATGSTAVLGPIHRFLSRTVSEDPPDLDRLSSEDRAYLVPLLASLAASFGPAEYPRQARASAVSAGSSSGGPSRGS